MKSLIVYSSQSGNTKKLAQAVYESLTGCSRNRKN
jgi:flavodoxin